MNVKEKYSLWLNSINKDSVLYDELISITDSESEISDRFYKDIEFGTGGLRGVIGAGTNRMNELVIARATRGLAEYVIENGVEKKVVIAYDSRRMSREFAFCAANVLSSMGISVYIFADIMPTPILSYAVRYYSAGAGIVITASHNPKEYNGYKVYNEHGCQITDNAAKLILDKISQGSYFFEYEKNESLIKVLDDGLLEEYLDNIAKLSMINITEETAPKIVYTPLHGTGNIPVKRILLKIGIKDVIIVKEQEEPDGEFTTCPYPNPEERETLSLAIEYAKANNAELILATDPDADRVGIAARDKNGEYRLFNGNETGALLLDYILHMRAEKGILGKNPVAIKTIVTTDMAVNIVKKYGATVRDVLTGFKYIGEEMDKIDNFVMGMEESYGYLVGTHARDKDAVSAAMMIAEMYAYYKKAGKSLCDALDDLYSEYGYYVTDLISKTYKGEDGARQMAEIISKIRNNPIRSLNGEAVAFTDFSLGVGTLPKSNVLRVQNDNIRVLIRPSGTEPKMKVYYQVKADSFENAKILLEKVKSEISESMSN